MATSNPRQCAPYMASLVLLGLTPAEAEQPRYGLAIEKLEHLFETHTSVFEFEVTRGTENSYAGLKTESEFASGSYTASESQLYYHRAINSRLSGRVGGRYLNSDVDDKTSAMLGLIAYMPFDVEIVISAFVDDAKTEGRLEIERLMQLSPRTELQPKVEFSAFSHDVDSVAAELRLAYSGTDRLSLYVGAEWSREFGTDSAQNELTALAGLSYEW